MSFRLKTLKASSAMGDIKVLHISQIKPTSFTPSIPKRNQNGALRVDLTYSDPALAGCVYLLQTPKLRLPFGLSCNEFNDNSKSYSLSMSLDNLKSGSDSEMQFVKGIQLIDDHIKRLAVENSKAWFKTSMSEQVIDELYKPSIRYSDDWAPLFRCKLPFWDDKFACDFYDGSKNKVSPLDIKPNSNSICLLQLSSIWFMAKQFGCVWTVRQGQNFPQIKYDDFLIQGNDDDEDEKMDVASDDGDNAIVT